MFLLTAGCYSRTISRFNDAYVKINRLKSQNVCCFKNSCFYFIYLGTAL